MTLSIMNSLVDINRSAQEDVRVRCIIEATTFAQLFLLRQGERTCGRERLCCFRAVCLYQEVIHDDVTRPPPPYPPEKQVRKKRARTFLQQECEERLRPCSVCSSVGVIGASFVIGSEKNKREEHRNDKRPRPFF